MSEEGSTPVAPAPQAQPADAENKNTAADAAKADSTPIVPVVEPKVEDAEESKPAEPEPAKESEEKAAKPEEPTEKTAEEPDEKPAEKPADEPTEKPSEDVEMADAGDAALKEEEKPEPTEDTAAPAAGDDATTATATAAAATPKPKTPARRKSTAGADSAKGKKLNKKGSKAAILHLDAQPGEHYFIKLKGFPQWPCIICDEDMLPHALLKTRPVSALRSDGTYRDDFADGGKRAADRTFPIMYLATNEFGWVSNKDLITLDPEKVMEQVNSKMRKDLLAAHELAAENYDLDYYKGVLHQFQQELIEKQKAAEAKAAAAATPKSSKKKAKATADEDVEMEDVGDEPSAKKDKKRKNPEGSETPQRADSVKKPKIKLTNNSTPKSNGAASKSAKAGGETKASKKAKKPKEDSEELVQTPKEPEMSAEDRWERKKKEVLYLRHKLQKGLLTRNEQPKEDEMKLMSDYLTKLEGFLDLDVEIIRATKINKVLKAMLKLDNIPKEEEFEFKSRSQVLLDKWNQLLSDGAPNSAGLEETNGVNGHKAEKAPVKEEAKPAVNGADKADVEEPEAPEKESKPEVKPEESKTEVKEAEETKEASKEETSSAEEKAVPKKEVSPDEDKPKTDEANSAEAEAVDAAA